MKKEDFVKSFMKGVENSKGDTSTLIKSLLGVVYDERLKNSEFKLLVDFMDDVAGDSGWSMTCISCGESFEPDCELSEMYKAEVCCGKNQWCCL